MRASKEEGEVPSPPSSRALIASSLLKPAMRTISCKAERYRYQRKRKSANWLFADSAVLYGVFKDCNDAESLQQDLNTLVHWADTWQMSFNAKKFTILRVSCSKSLVEYLEAVDRHKYLGDELSNDLNWDVHIAGMIGKANRSVGFKRRNLNKCPENVKEQAYLALVRP